MTMRPAHAIGAQVEATLLNMGRGHNGLYVGAGLFEGPSVMFDPEWGEEF
jgi:hypothetical protein